MPRRGRHVVPAGVYLLAHSVGALPVAALRARDAFFRQWAAKGGDGWHDWLPEAFHGFSSALAGLLGGRPSEFCPQANVSSGLTKLVGALPRRKGRRKILLSELDFPTVGFVLAQARRLGYELEFLSAERTRGGPDGWTKALSEKVELALITHAYFGDSTLSDPKAVSALARARGVLTVVDVAQSAGVVPVDLKAWDADFAVGSSIKWLCGGPGAGYLWVNSRNLARCRPTDVGWFSHERPMDFDIRDFRYAPDARRFAGGTPSALPFILAAAAVRQAAATGVERIRAHNLSLTRLLLEKADERGLAVRTPRLPERRGGTVTIDFKNAARTLARLHKAGIRCDLRSDYGIRFSPHIYNTRKDIEALCRALQREQAGQGQFSRSISKV